jgi:hypothetical protein
MATVHVQCIGDNALLPQGEFERLVELAQRYEEITVQRQEDDVPTLGSCVWRSRVALSTSGRRRGRTFTRPASSILAASLVRLSSLAASQRCASSWLKVIMAYT